jgi:hypothetical protein
MSDDKTQTPPEKAEPPSETPAQSATFRGNMPADLEAARRAAGRGANGAGPYASRKRPAYSIT